MRQCRPDKRPRHISQGARLFGVLRLDRQRFRDQTIEIGTPHRINVFLISVFKSNYLGALPMLDLGNPQLKQPPEFIGHFKSVLRTDGFEPCVLRRLEVNG